LSYAWGSQRSSPSRPPRPPSKPNERTIVKEGDVTVVKNPKEPLYQTPILELKEELSLGGPEAQGEYAFGQIADLVVDDAGSFYVLDGRSSHVKVFDASGRYVRTIGRAGQGPGEFEQPMNLSFNGATASSPSSAVTDGVLQARWHVPP